MRPAEKERENSFHHSQLQLPDSRERKKKNNVTETSTNNEEF
jgi:hypothetical protein